MPIWVVMAVKTYRHHISTSLRTSDNRLLRGSKGNAYEAGLRVPLIVKWPGKTPEGVVLEEMVASLDIGTTTIAMAGGAVQSKR